MRIVFNRSLPLAAVGRDEHRNVIPSSNAKTGKGQECSLFASKNGSALYAILPAMASMCFPSLFRSPFLQGTQSDSPSPFFFSNKTTPLSLS